MSTWVVGMIAAAGGILAAVLPVWLTNRRHPSRRVQDGASIVDAAENVVSLLRGEVSRLADEVNALRAELGAEERRTDGLEENLKALESTLEEYRRGVGMLIAQISALGQNPAWRPQDL